MLINDILSRRSVSIVGLAKNAGKTETLNWLLRHANALGHAAGVTSIGLDGETHDAVTATRKPEITLFPGVTFVTSETHYRQRRLTTEVLDVSQRQTALGRLVTARAHDTGKVMLSGPNDTASLRWHIRQLHELGAATVFVDGALSRLSLGAPTVADAIILATGAAVSSTIGGVVRQTKYVCDLITLPKFPCPALSGKESGVWAVDGKGDAYDLDIPSVFMLDKAKDRLWAHGTTLFTAGAVSDKLLVFLRQQPQCGQTTLVMRDFTRMFATPENYYAYIKRGGKLAVLDKTSLLSITVNPTSPQGVTLDSKNLVAQLADATGVPTYDLLSN